MIKFVDDIIAFLEDKFANDTDFSKEIKGYYAYKSGLKPNATTPYFVVQLLDNQSGKEEFDKETTAITPIQITVYGVTMKVSNKLTDAQLVSGIMFDKVINYMNDYKYTTTKIGSMRRMGSGANMIDYDGSGKTYYSALRYSIEIKLPYV